MPEVTINGPAGRIEGRFAVGTTHRAPVALLIHPHPAYGGNMNNKVVFTLFKAFTRLGWAALRFNFRGVGRSEGRFDRGEGELADAAAALDWLQTVNPTAASCWIAGYSFGAWIGMQLLMRRPEIAGFVSVSPPANMLDFGFLSPCPSSGLVVHGDNDDLVPEASVARLVHRLSHQREIRIDYHVVEGANHQFEDRLDSLSHCVGRYVAGLQPASLAVECASSGP